MRGGYLCRRQIGISQVGPDVLSDPQAEGCLQRPLGQAGVVVLGRQDGTEEFDAGFHDGVGMHTLVQFVAAGQLGEVGEGEARNGVVGSQGDRGDVS
ncbi:hypothetical protein QFZ76_000570 [Streptomyces sp. V4I2]|nr:hypothetical protein [Streptomyces sp. V4I2]